MWKPQQWMRCAPAVRGRSMVRRLVLLMILWQIAVLLFAGLGSRLWHGAPLAPTTVEQHPWLEPLLEPSATDRAVLLQRVQGYREMHVQAMRLAQAIVERYREDPKDTSFEAWRRASWEPWPIFYRRYSVVPSRRPKEAYALEAARRCVYTKETLAGLDAMSELPRYQKQDWQSYIRHARLLVHVGRGDWAEAAREIPDNPNRYSKQPHPLVEAIEKSEAQPDSFSNRMDLVNALGYTVLLRSQAVHADLLWRAYDVAASDTERLEALRAIAALDGNRCGAPRSSLAHALHTICAGLACRNSTYRKELAAALAALAGCSSQPDDRHTSLALYSVVAERLEDTSSWGLSVFNQAYLLREDRRPAAAIAAIAPIFDSNVNDRDRGPHLMEAYRNYRHRSARLVADAYRDQWNYPAAWLWDWRAAEKYRYRSWCGTCRMGEQRRSFWRLAKASVAAGPIPCIFNFTAAPVRNWRFWVGIGVVTIVVRMVRKRRRRKHATAPS